MEQLIVSPHLNPLPQGERADASATTLAANLKGEHSQPKLTGHGCVPEPAIQGNLLEPL